MNAALFIVATHCRVACCWHNFLTVGIVVETHLTMNKAVGVGHANGLGIFTV